MYYVLYKIISQVAWRSLTWSWLTPFGKFRGRCNDDLLEVKMTIQILEVNCHSMLHSIKRWPRGIWLAGFLKTTVFWFVYKQKKWKKIRKQSYVIRWDDMVPKVSVSDIPRRCQTLQLLKKNYSNIYMITPPQVLAKPRSFPFLAILSHMCVCDFKSFQKHHWHDPCMKSWTKKKRCNSCYSAPLKRIRNKDFFPSESFLWKVYFVFIFFICSLFDGGWSWSLDYRFPLLLMRWWRDIDDDDGFLESRVLYDRQ